VAIEARGISTDASEPLTKVHANDLVRAGLSVGMQAAASSRSAIQIYSEDSHKSGFLERRRFGSPNSITRAV
jgi:hypothetical protein